jgi:ADP-heptose:LPS heptosyltransferase
MRVLVLRFSALGDISLLLPVLNKWQQDQPQLEIALMSRPYIAALCEEQNFSFYPADIDNDFRGLRGLWRLARRVKKDFKPDLIVDQHNVLRTKILGSFWQLMGLKVVRIEKNRKLRKLLVRYPHKRREALTHVSELYAQSIQKTGYPVSFSPQTDHHITYTLAPFTRTFWEKERSEINIGIAPFAMHENKMWPIEKMSKLLKELPLKELKIWFFGGPKESEALAELGQACGKPFTVVAGRFKLDQEVALMSKLKAFIAMDSSNMHLASIADIPVVSIWGATHPYAGFAPYGDNQQYIVQLDESELDCRPCSIYGNKPCFRGDRACLTRLPELRVQNSLMKALSAS